MKRLYEKNEVLFAVIWIVFYVIGTSLADSISLAAGIEKLVTVFWCAALAVILGIWIAKNGLREKFGLTLPKASPRAFLYYIPLLLIVSCNLWFGAKLNFSPAETVMYVISMLFIGFIEEIIFRGLLFKVMAKDGLRSAVIVSSLTFGIGHIVNLFNASGAGLIETVCQICYAVLFGFLFVVIFCRSGSLIPCIAAHSLLNALSAFSAQPGSVSVSIAVSLVLCVIAGGYAFVLMKTIPQDQKEKHHEI